MIFLKMDIIWIRTHFGYRIILIHLLKRFVFFVICMQIWVTAIILLLLEGIFWFFIGYRPCISYPNHESGDIVLKLFVRWNYMFNIYMKSFINIVSMKTFLYKNKDISQRKLCHRCKHRTKQFESISIYDLPYTGI